MNVVWLLNAPIGFSAEALFGITTQSGGWINVTLNSLETALLSNELTVHVIVPTPTFHESIEFSHNVVCHYISWDSFKMGVPASRKDEKTLKKLLCKLKPDIVMAWGTEYALTVCGMRISKELGVKTITYIQGIINTFLPLKNGYLSIYRMNNYLNVIDKLKNSFANRRYYKQLKSQSIFESEQLQNSDVFISDNEWCKNQIEYINKNIQYVYSLLPLNDIYKNARWDINVAKRHTIFTVAGRNAYKGLHVLIEAIQLIKTQYPDVKVIIPGNMSYSRPAWLKKPPYIAYIDNLIRKLGISENVEFVGKLDSIQMLQQFSRAHCFVMPSAIENHSSTLREAMFVGVPCISSFVGSIGELIQNGYNGLIYRYEDAVALAASVIKVFSDDMFARKIAENANASITRMYVTQEKHDSMIEIYRKLGIAV